MEFKPTLKNNIKAEYPVNEYRCDKILDCPMYKYVLSSYNERKDEAFSPREQRHNEDAIIDFSVTSLDDMLAALYGGHVCTAQEMKTKQVNAVVYEEMRMSYHSGCFDRYYEVCKHMWFRRIFSLVPEPTDITVNNWEAAQKIGVLNAYFGVHNVLNLPFVDIGGRDQKKTYNFVYNDDYEAYARQYLGNSVYDGQMRDLILESPSLQDESDLERIDCLSVVADFINDRMIKPDDYLYTEVSMKDWFYLMQVTKKFIINNLDKTISYTDVALPIRGILLCFFDLVPSVYLNGIGGSFIVISKRYQPMFSMYEYRAPYYIYYNIRDNEPVLSQLSIKKVDKIVNSHGYGRFHRISREMTSLMPYNIFSRLRDDYALAPWYDGDRCVVFFERKDIYLLQNGKMSRVGATYDSSLKGVVCDCMVLDKVIIILDVIWYGGRDVSNMRLCDRVGFCRLIYNKVSLIDYYRLVYQQYTTLDNFVSLKKLINLFPFEERSSKGWPTRGLVFMPINPYGMHRDLKMFLWSPIGDTILFKVELVDNKPWLCVYDQSRSVPVVSTLDLTYLDQIVECYQKQGIWLVFRVRQDRTYPSSLGVYKNIMKFGSEKASKEFANELEWNKGK